MARPKPRKTPAKLFAEQMEGSYNVNKEDRILGEIESKGPRCSRGNSHEDGSCNGCNGRGLVTVIALGSLYIRVCDVCMAKMVRWWRDR